MVCSDGINITIQKIKNYDSNILIESGMLNKKVFSFIKSLILKNKNLIISGPINSGKTVLLDVILKEILNTKRVYLAENSSRISAEFDTLVKFNVDKYENYNDVIAHIQKLYPEYFVADLNKADIEFSDLQNKIVTLRALNAQNTIKELAASYMKNGGTEKYAKQRILIDYDYIINLIKTDDGKMVLESISEIQPAKTGVLTVTNVLVKVNDKYILADEKFKTLKA